MLDIIIYTTQLRSERAASFWPLIPSHLYFVIQSWEKSNEIIDRQAFTQTVKYCALVNVCNLVMWAQILGGNYKMDLFHIKLHQGNKVRPTFLICSALFSEPRRVIGTFPDIRVQVERLEWALEMTFVCPSDPQGCFSVVLFWGLCGFRFG